MLWRQGASRRRGRLGSQFSTKRSRPLRTRRLRKRYHSARSSSPGVSPSWSSRRPVCFKLSQKSSQACPLSRRRDAALRIGSGVSMSVLRTDGETIKVKGEALAQLGRIDAEILLQPVQDLPVLAPRVVPQVGSELLSGQVCKL